MSTHIIALILLLCLLISALFASLYSLMSFRLNREELEAKNQSRVDPNKLRNLRKKASVKASGKKAKDSIESLLFRAGYYSAKSKFEYRKQCILYPLVIAPVVGISIHFLFHNRIASLASLAFGLLVGLQLPKSKLAEKVKQKEEEVFYFLPMVLESLVIGTSSGLEPATCITTIIDISKVRGSTNAVIDLFIHAIRLVRSGLQFEQALEAMGQSSGVRDLQSTFSFLAQSSKEGGELSKQLQDLSETVAMTRQQQVERKISTLAVKATFPLALVFMGFLGMILSCAFIMLLKGVSKMS